ncbi:MAG: oxepin-CoA hydrolase/3-oxo-5,6-dehydrosuberyl-CoA semialdehyde dehydrogenase [Verrucomicrobiales bacterium]|jgi:oxepin-CoA hydrolase/3-oxo-5,6-dehydrosuberyl-CoA semialdehyde dehydrogenase
MSGDSLSGDVLEHYVAGRWIAGGSGGQKYVNATTGERLGTVSSDGLDMAAIVEHARTDGNPAVSALSFHERATILRNVGKLLLDDEVKASLYGLSALTGATGKDSWVDIDGGAGVLLAYASKGRKELPNATVIVDGAYEPLSRDGSFGAIHVRTSRTGVAVQINAYNFPVWGMLEKFAPSFLAGLPSIVKPAPQTAFLTQAAVRVIIDSGLLPEGSLQLICGGPGDLLDHLDGQDSVAFTGSATTGAIIRSHENLVAKSVHVTTETDSINSAVLAPSASPGTPEFDLFVAEVVSEMTTKAGQKCTAIRRVFAPEAHVEAASEAVSAALALVVIGDPAIEAVTMGALIDGDQRERVRESIAQLSMAADVVFGGASSDAVAVVGADAEAGAFVAPTLLRATDRFADVIHSIEAFGPVSTVVPYASVAEAIDLVARGGGSLVASVYGSDVDEIAELAKGIASHHGRVLVVDETMAKANTGHGAPLPNLIHGGPGRAGGGEELGGVRSVFSHMQRTAVQGSPGMLTAIGGEYITGAPTMDKGHPFRLTFDDLNIGDSLTTDSRVVTSADISHFADFTGDTFYAHMDEAAAARSPIFGGIVAHGYLVLSFAAGLFVDPPEGPVLANYGIDRLRFATPTRPGDEIHAVLTCKRKTQLDSRGYGEVAWDTKVINQKGEVAAAYDVLTMVANAPGLNGAPL